jgi:hypothetical protein
MRMMRLAFRNESSSPPALARTWSSPDRFAGAARTPTRSVARLVVLCAALMLLGGCSWVSGVFGGGKPTESSTAVSVFKVEPGQCFNPPSGVKAELSELAAVACTQPHTQEAYAGLTYQPPAGGDASVYPGDAALASFAKGACAQAFTAYVGVSYLDSSLFFTFLLPSARSWEQGSDRTVLCFVLTTGKPLTKTVKGSKL